LVFRGERALSTKFPDKSKFRIVLREKSPLSGAERLGMPIAGIMDLEAEAKGLFGGL
jgi:hypothetical protein